MSVRIGYMHKARKKTTITFLYPQTTTNGDYTAGGKIDNKSTICDFTMLMLLRVKQII